MLPFSTLTWPLFILSSRIIYTDNRLNRTGNLQTYFSRSVDMSCCTCRLYMNVIELCWEHFVFPHFMSDDLCQLQRMSIWERLKWSFLFLFLFSFSFFLLCWWSIVRCNKEKTNQNLNIQFLTTFFFNYNDPNIWPNRNDEISLFVGDKYMEGVCRHFIWRMHDDFSILLIVETRKKLFYQQFHWVKCHLRWLDMRGRAMAVYL